MLARCRSSTAIRHAARTGRRCVCASAAARSSTRMRQGVAQDLRGLTLLEAAAVGGETAPGRRARKRARPCGARAARRAPGRRGAERRRRQRRRAAACRPRGGRGDAAAVDGSRRPGRRALVLLAERGRRGPADVPRPRVAAHHARPARGVPPRRRHAVHPRLRARRDAESVRPLQRRVPLRRAARVRAPRRRAAARDRALRADRRASRAARCSPARATAGRIRATCSRGSTRAASTASGSRSATRRKDETLARGRGGGAGGRTAPREPGGVLPRAATTTARSSAAAGCRRPPGDIVDEAGARVGTHDGYWRFTPGPAARARRRRRPSRSTRSRPTRDRTRSPIGPRSSLARTRVSARGRLFADADTGRGEAPLRLAGGRGVGRADWRPGSGCSSTSRRTAWRAGRRQCSTTATWSSAPGWLPPPRARLVGFAP